MTFQGDPHRTLGVAPGASLNEIKSAYRRLVKKYHPDAAGERALPRFLAIQEAYERLVDPEGRLRPTPGPGRAAPTPSQPWRADPARARASRDAWRARRSGAAAAGAASGGSRAKSGTGSGGGTAAGQGGSTAGGHGSSTTGGPGGSTRRERPHREHHARRGPRKATPGSTTYDEAAELPLDPEWDGGAWYGPSSGTYWTINPREYADPRKHGPEYQARARRAAQAQRAGIAEEADGASAPGPSPATDAAGPSPRWRWTGGHATQTAGGAEWGTGDWRYDEGVGARADTATPGPVAAPSDLEAVARRIAPSGLLALARADRRWLAALAVVAWPPIGWAAGALVVQATACAPAAPGCSPVLQLAPVAVQVLIVIALYLVPAAAAVGAFASLAALAVALPTAAVLALASGDGDRASGPALGIAVAVGYLTALAIGARTAWRTPDGTGRPPPAP